MRLKLARKPKMTDLLQWGAVLVVLYGGLCLFAVVMADRLIFPAPPPSYSEESVTLRIPVEDGSDIAAVWLPASPERSTILYCHGNAEDLGDIRPVLDQLRERGFSVLAFDYPGYGLSDGEPSEEGCIAATDAAYTYLRDVRRVNPARIIAYGRSLGSGPAVDLATREPLGGLILEGAFTSCFRVMTNVSILPWDVFDNLAKIPSVTCPVWSVHGNLDRTVPIDHAKKLYAAIKSPRMRLWVLTAGHNDLLTQAGEIYWQNLDRFTRLVEAHQSNQSQSNQSPHLSQNPQRNP